MLTDKQRPIKLSEPEIQQLHLSVEECHSIQREDRNQLAIVEDKEYFIRKAFIRDEWEGCTLGFEYYCMPLCSHAIRFVHSKVYAENILSDVFLTFWQKRHFRRVNTPFRTDLFQVVRNQSLNFIRNEFGQDIHLPGDEHIISRSISPDTQMMYDKFYHRVQEGIFRLLPRCKKKFLMSRFEDIPLKEIASIHNISHRTVEPRISKALRIMLEALDYMRLYARLRYKKRKFDLNPKH